MAAIFFGSNTIVNGTNGDDSMVGNATGGNVNDLVYGHQGNDTITADSLSRSTLFGGQGDDDIVVFSGGFNQIYGNLGNDFLESADGTGDSIFGGQGDDSIVAVGDTSGSIYGNQGNDSIIGDVNQFTNYFGGQGNDTIVDVASNLDAIYGNQGNDFLYGNDGISNSHMFGGQGDDTLVFTGTDRGHTTNDAETGGQGNDFFVASNDSGSPGPGAEGNALLVHDIVTVTDFLQGNDKLSETSEANVGLTKIDGAGDNAAQALTAANDFYSGHSNSEYVFVYGGVGAGYLFYNGDNNSSDVATAGMAITGATAESSVNSSDIVPFKPGTDTHLIPP